MEMFLLSFNQLMCFSFQLYLISYVDVMHDLLNARKTSHSVGEKVCATCRQTEISPVNRKLGICSLW